MTFQSALKLDLEFGGYSFTWSPGPQEILSREYVVPDLGISFVIARRPSDGHNIQQLALCYSVTDAAKSELVDTDRVSVKAWYGHTWIPAPMNRNPVHVGVAMALIQAFATGGSHPAGVTGFEQLRGFEYSGEDIRATIAFRMKGQPAGFHEAQYQAYSPAVGDFPPR